MRSRVPAAREEAVRGSVLFGTFGQAVFPLSAPPPNTRAVFPEFFVFRGLSLKTLQ